MAALPFPPHAAPLSRRAILAALAVTAPAAAGAAGVWTVLPLPEGRELRRAGPARSEAALVFFPGAACDASRYTWLGALASPRMSVYLFSPAPSPRITVCGVKDVVASFDLVRPQHRRLLAGGHSAGGAAVLDTFDPAAATAPRYGLPPGYRPPEDIAGAIVLGSSLQPQMLNAVLPHRNEDTPLSRPGDFPLLFVCGDHDLVATPQLMQKTRARFRPPTDLAMIPGASHHGWADGHGPADRADFNAPGAIAPKVQQQLTASAISEWLKSRGWA